MVRHGARRISSSLATNATATLDILTLTSIMPEYTYSIVTPGIRRALCPVSAAARGAKAAKDAMFRKQIYEQKGIDFVH